MVGVFAANLEVDMSPLASATSEQGLDLSV